MTSFENENDTQSTKKYDINELISEFSGDREAEEEDDDTPLTEPPVSPPDDTPEKKKLPRERILFGISAGILLLALLISGVLILRSAEIRNLLIPTVPSTEPSANESTDEPSTTEPSSLPPQPTGPIEIETPTGAYKSTRRNYLIYTLDREEKPSALFLFGIDTDAPEARLLCLPLDSFIFGEGDVSRLSEAYGAQDAQALCAEVEKIVGFTLDGAIGLTQTALSSLSEQLGGIHLTLSAAPAYTDRSFTSGEQTLSGDSFAALFRFRSGYSEVRPESYHTVQHEALAALLQTVLQQPEQSRDETLRLFLRLARTELTEGNLAYYAELLQEVPLEQMESDVLSGRAITIDSQKYYELSAQTALKLLNGGYNPLARNLKLSDLTIRSKEDAQRPTTPIVPTTTKRPTPTTEPTEPFDPTNANEPSESSDSEAPNEPTESSDSEAPTEHTESNDP